MKILTIVCFCFWEDTSEASAIFVFDLAFGVWGLPLTRHRVGILHGSEKVPCVSLLYAFLNLWTFLRIFEEIALD